MATLNQLVKKKLHFFKPVIKLQLLTHKPQRKGICVLISWVPPKKPNSARRHIAKVAFRTIKRKSFCYIPGEGHNLKKHSIVLIRGGRVKDVPGLKYRVIRGVYSSDPVATRVNSRSKYGLLMWKKKIKIKYV